MIFTLSDIQNYSLNAPHYEDACSMVVSGGNDTDVNALRVYLQNITKKAPDFAWLMVDSTTDSNFCERISLKTGKVGRPKTIVKGKKIGRHVHVIGVSLSNNINLSQTRKQFNDYIRKRRKKHPNLKQPKTQPCNSMRYIPYMIKQANHVYSSSNYNWKYFDTDWFDDKV